MENETVERLGFWKVGQGIGDQAPWGLTMMNKTAIALEAYEKLAEVFSQLAPDKAENAYIEQPAMREKIGHVAGLHILDAGCGPGILASYLVSKGASVTGLDVSPKMLELAKGRLGDKAVLHLANMAEPMPFLASGAFDLIASSLAIDYVRDWSVPLAEFWRVLKPGGRLVFSAQHPVGSFLWYQLESYSGVQYVEWPWKGFGGIQVAMPDHYRSIEETMNPLVRAGFLLQSVTETKPVEALKAREPEKYEKFMKKPPFILFEAKKPPV
jgi:ubiquinone/menaquinone biosynthesis C-methylase UbiE